MLLFKLANCPLNVAISEDIITLAYSASDVECDTSELAQ